MKKISLKVLTLMAVLTTAGLVVDETSNDEALNQIAGYRQWTRVNRESIQIAAIPIGETGI